MQYPVRAGSEAESGHHCAPRARKARIPVTLIGGFLGAGKTTLLNHIICNAQGMQLAAIIREYGPVGLDDKLMSARPLHVRVMPGISLHHDPQLLLYHTMEHLYSRCAEGGWAEQSPHELEFDHLLVEASGLDNPEYLVQLFFLEGLRDHYRLDSYIAVVDAEYGDVNLDEYRVARVQVAFADIILLNKIDLVDSAKIGGLMRRLRSINPVANIYHTEYARVCLRDLLDVGLFDHVPGPTHLAEIPAPAEGQRPWTREDGVGVDEIRTVVLSEKRPMDKEKVNEWVKHLFLTRGAKILRSKGFLYFAGTDYRYVFQAVRKTFHSRADRLWDPGEERASVIVLIGEELGDLAELQESFSNCVAEVVSGRSS